ncbi:hemerythrin domain-containing protein [Halomonas cerina]|uniref:Hemerythrin-like domain-containing protein n=1 Tax=Halomonas cerina TaxID=447424 RepID=A0A839VA69_9GAMM|nr:hemerythrin domain-containing protein [Halomonas cerina]MBB3190339.1 hemerythrin-like domain-containing protein [Halomonas cerina]
MKAILLERLHADHYRYEALLCILDRQLHIAACQEVPDHQLLARLFHYLTRQPEEWHHGVEDRLFECLAAHHPVSRELLAVLVEEHHRIATYGRELEAKMRRLADECPDEELDINTLNLARAFSELYHHHLHTENHRVFPLFEVHLPADELEHLALAPLVAPAEGSPDFQRLYRQIAAGRTGLKLGHDEQADFCPLCDARPTAAVEP